MNTGLAALDFIRRPQAVFYDSSGLYTLSRHMLRDTATHRLYCFNLSDGTNRELPLKIPKLRSKHNPFIYIEDLLLFKDNLYIALSEPYILCYRKNAAGRYVYRHTLELPYRAGRLYIAEGLMVAEDYFNYRPAVQGPNHTRMLIDPLSGRVKEVLFPDSSSLLFTSHTHHFSDICGTQSLAVQSAELRLLLGQYNRADYTDTIQLQHRYPAPCDVSGLRYNEGNSGPNHEQVRMLDKTCLERIEKAIFLDANRILVSINYPLNDSTAFSNSGKRMLVLKRTAMGWETVLDELIRWEPVDDNGVRSIFFRAAYPYASITETFAHNGRLYAFNYGKPVLPDLPLDKEAYRQKCLEMYRQNPALKDGLWLEVYDFSGL